MIVYLLACGPQEDYISISMRTAIEGVKFSIVVTVWTLYQLAKPTLALVALAACLRPFII